MTFTKITSIDVEITKEEEESLTSVFNFINSLIDEMEENSLDTVGCDDYGDTYHITCDELCQIQIYLEKLKDIQNIC